MFFHFCYYLLKNQRFLLKKNPKTVKTKNVVLEDIENNLKRIQFNYVCFFVIYLKYLNLTTF